MQQRILNNLGKILDMFNVEYHEYLNRFQGKCPIHKGDNPNAFCIYKETGAWRCFTLGCHETYGASVNGLIRGFLSDKHKRLVSHQEVNKFLEDLVGGKVEEFSSDMNYAFFLQDKNVQKKVTRDNIKKKLEIPGQYFINRGFSKEVLEKYDVGLYKNVKSKLYNRCVAPIYDLDYKYVIGITGRDITERSKVKWLHSSFPRDSTLYNSWFAKNQIQETNTCILVESLGNVWRLEEAGFHQSLGIFGTQLSFGQMRLLSRLGVLNIVLLLDNDKAGKESAAKIVKKLKGLYNIVIPEMKYEDDIAECKIDYLQDRLTPILKGL